MKTSSWTHARVTGALTAATLLGIGALLFGPLRTPAAAQQQETTRTLTVTGAGQVSVAPEVATVRLGTQSRAATAREAVETVNTQIAAIVAALKSRGVPENRIQTESMNVYPVNERSDQAAPVLYQASSILSIELADVNEAGPTIDAAVAAGANQIQGVQFGLRDEAAARQRAIDAAVQKAKAEAASLAQSLGVRLGSVRSATIAGGGAPRATFQRADSAAAIQPGQIDLTVQVEVIFDIS
ncbi:MAG: SIMPL domain-containing protein [Dehalococcoidia bacterium]